MGASDPIAVAQTLRCLMAIIIVHRVHQPIDECCSVAIAARCRLPAVTALLRCQAISPVNLRLLAGKLQFYPQYYAETRCSNYRTYSVLMADKESYRITRTGQSGVVDPFIGIESIGSASFVGHPLWIGWVSQLCRFLGRADRFGWVWRGRSGRSNWVNGLVGSFGLSVRPHWSSSGRSRQALEANCFQNRKWIARTRFPIFIRSLKPFEVVMFHCGKHFPKYEIVAHRKVSGNWKLWN